MKTFKTIRKEASDEFIVNKSRFIGYACPCQTEEEALAFLAKIRQKHKDATHNCYAYIIGENAGIMRYSDDGEPGGTAGMPIIEVMKAQGVVNLCVVVTRYFGGVLLGAGGLVRAYTNGCVIALKAAQVVAMEPTQRWWAEVAYPLWDKVLHSLKSQPIILEETDFSATVNCTIMVREKDANDLCDLLTRLTDGRVEMMLSEELHYPWAVTETND